jgi:competence protein ComEC
LGFSTALLGFIFLPAAKILAETIWLLLWFLEKIATGVGKMPGSFFYIGAPSLLLIGAYYSGLIMVLEYLKKDKPIRLGMKNAMTIALAFAAILVWNGLFSPTVFGKEELTVTFIDVGQGDAILIETPQGKKILIDGSGMERREINDDPTVGEKPDRIGRKVVLPFLRKKGINRLDLVFLTHPHEDHLGGLNEVLKAVKVNQVIDAGSLYNSLAYQRFKELIAANKIKYAVARMGQEINFGNNLKAEILWPGREQLENVNSNSIVMRLVYGEVAFLFTGDLEKEGEERLLKYYSGRLHSTVLKVGHHGSLTSTGDDFLRAIGPKYAVISVGKRNRYQHPAASTIKRLIEHWIKVFRTDLNGAITVRTDGCRLAIATQK